MVQNWNFRFTCESEYKPNKGKTTAMLIVWVPYSNNHHGPKIYRNLMCIINKVSKLMPVICTYSTLGTLHANNAMQGLSLSDVMLVTKRNMASAVQSMSKQVEQVSSALAVCLTLNFV
jgi:hypothetical protein